MKLERSPGLARGAAGSINSAIVQIVPTLPPAISGVGDYAFLLARGLHGHGWRTTFVVANEQGERELEAHRVIGLPNGGRASAIVDALEDVGAITVLLHYSGYGYAKRGAPLWLARGLRRWKTEASRRRLVVMFHELWAFGPPWRSSFWLFPLQRALAASLLRLADVFLTNTELHAARAQRLLPDRAPAVVLPVPSNIGEPTAPPPLDTREPLAIVFGQPSVRSRVYAHVEDFVSVLRPAGIERILDIGPPLEKPPISRLPLPVIRCGYLDPASASAAMLRARVGVLDYPLKYVAKSSILAAYAAHGLVPLIRSAGDTAADGLRHGVNLLRAGEEMPRLPAAAQPLATAAHLWYREHALERAVACFAEAIRPDSSGTQQVG